MEIYGKTDNFLFDREAMIMLSIVKSLTKMGYKSKKLNPTGLFDVTCNEIHIGNPMDNHYATDNMYFSKILNLSFRQNH